MSYRGGARLHSVTLPQAGYLTLGSRARRQGAVPCRFLSRKKKREKAQGNGIWSKNRAMFLSCSRSCSLDERWVTREERFFLPMRRPCRPRLGGRARKRRGEHNGMLPFIFILFFLSGEMEAKKTRLPQAEPRSEPASNAPLAGGWLLLLLLKGETKDERWEGE